MRSKHGIAGPAALPDEIANRLQQVTKETLEDPVFVQSVKSDAPVIACMPGAKWTESLTSHPASRQSFVERMQEQGAWLPLKSQGFKGDRKLKFFVRGY